MLKIKIMAKPKEPQGPKEHKELEEYKEYVKKRLTEITPILQKASVGDFLSKLTIPEKEDEFSELLVGLSLMMDDLRELVRTREEMEETRRKRLEELEQWRKLTVGRELKIVELKNELEATKREIESLKRRSDEPSLS